MEIIFNGQKRDVADASTVADLLAQMDRPVRQVAVEVNRSLVPRERHATHRLQPGDQVDVFTLAGGG